MNKSNEAQRKRLIKLIHVAKRDLSMAEDSYRAIVIKITQGRGDSAKDCTIIELERIISHFKQVGFKVRKPKPAKPKETRALNTEAEASKARAVWLLLHELGAVKNPSEAALNAYVKRMTGVEDLGWLNGDQMLTVIETLKKWAVRVFKPALQLLIIKAKSKGVLGAGATLQSVVSFYAPRLSVDTFDALNTTYDNIQSILIYQEIATPKFYETSSSTQEKVPVPDRILKASQ